MQTNGKGIHSLNRWGHKRLQRRQFPLAGVVGKGDATGDAPRRQRIPAPIVLAHANDAKGKGAPGKLIQNRIRRLTVYLTLDCVPVRTLPSLSVIGWRPR
jgi:hypothetical protein